MYYYIYKITCTKGSLTGKYYIGQHRTENLQDNYKGSGTLLKKYYKKYPNDYTKEILCFCNNETELNDKENEFIGNLYETDPNCLNLCPGGGAPPTLCGNKNGFYGKHHTEETKLKHSLFMKKYYETHQQFWKNKHLPKNICEKISITKKQQKIWVGENNFWFGKHRFNEDNPFFGKHHTEETKEKMSKKVKIDNKIFNSYKDAANYLQITPGYFSRLKKNSCISYKKHIINWNID